MTLFKLLMPLAAASLGALFAGCGAGDDSLKSDQPEPVGTSTVLAVKQAPQDSNPTERFTVTSLVKVGETRVGRTEYDYVFRIAVTNTGAAQANVTVTALSAGPGTHIIAGTVSLDLVEATSTTMSTQTITLRHDRQQPFNAALIAWSISATSNLTDLPPEPDPVSNAATVAGIDTNGNGIRDDVERRIATEFGADRAELARAYQHAEVLQSMLVSPDARTVAARAAFLQCQDASFLDRLESSTLATVNTKARSAAYASALAQMTLHVGSCGSQSFVKAIGLATPTRVLYVNGMRTSDTAAMMKAAALERELNSTTSYSGREKRSISVASIINPQGWFGNCSFDLPPQPCVFHSDLTEIFLMKGNEERYATVLPWLKQKHVFGYSLWDSYKYPLTNAFASDDLTPGNTSLERELIAHGYDPDELMRPTRNAISKLVANIKVNGPAVIVAHSEGNLLANLAYARLYADLGADIWKMARIVNVANNSIHSMNGLSLVHPGDSAIYVALPGMPDLYDWTRTTPICANAICKLGTPEATFTDMGLSSDLTGHDFVDTYLSTKTTYPQTEQAVDFVGSAAARDRLTDLVYAAAISLEGGVQWLRTSPTDAQYPGDGIEVLARESKYPNGEPAPNCVGANATVDINCFPLSRSVRIENYVESGIRTTVYLSEVDQVQGIMMLVGWGTGACYQRLQTTWSGPYSKVVENGANGIRLSLNSSVVKQMADNWATFLDGLKSAGCPTLPRNALRIEQVIPMIPENVNGFNIPKPARSIDAISVSPDIF